MLEGIEILNKVEIMEPPMWISIAGLVCFVWLLGGIILFFINVITDFLEDKWWIAFLIVIVSCLGISAMSVLNKNLLTEPTGIYEYQVTIDDSVSMNEFLEKYEIIDVKGKIYTIRDKEVE